MTDENEVFYLNGVYPDPDNIFSFNYKSANEIKDTCIFVLDTNALLVPFFTSGKNFEIIRKILFGLVKNKRLFLPARVVREFAKNRAEKIGEVFLKIRQFGKKIDSTLNPGNFKIEEYPLLEKNNDYKDLNIILGNIRDLISESRNCLKKIENHIQQWNWDDPISQEYKTIFTKETIVDVKKEKKDLIKDLNRRCKYNIAPGFKDKKKPDGGIGDLEIWQTIIEIGLDNDKDVIFVTNEKKNDWFYKQDKIALYPKYELLYEFHNNTNGKSVNLIDFPHFLELNDADNDTIEEVKHHVFLDQNSLNIENFINIINSIEAELTNMASNDKSFSDFVDRDPKRKRKILWSELINFIHNNNLITDDIYDELIILWDYKNRLIFSYYDFDTSEIDDICKKATNILMSIKSHEISS